MKSPIDVAKYPKKWLRLFRLCNIVVYSIMFRLERTENHVPVCKSVWDTPIPPQVKFRPVSAGLLFWLLVFIFFLSFESTGPKSLWVLISLLIDFSLLSVLISLPVRLQQLPPASSGWRHHSRLQLQAFAHCFCRLQPPPTVQSSPPKSLLLLSFFRPALSLCSLYLFLLFFFPFWFKCREL